MEQNLEEQMLSVDMKLGEGGVGQSPSQTTTSDANAETPTENIQQLLPMSAGPKIPCPPVEVKLFVGRVPRTYDEEAVKPLFAEFGHVLEVAIIKDKTTNAHKGSAFVRMQSLSQADQAIRSLHNIKVLDQSMGPMQVKYAVGEVERIGLNAEAANPASDQGKLFVGSLSKNASEKEIREVFEPYGAIDEIYIHRDPNSGLGKGCAFVKFALKESGVQACMALNGCLTFPGASRPAEVRFAEKKSGQPPVPMTQKFAGASNGQGCPVIVNKDQVVTGATREVGPWKEFLYLHKPEKPNELPRLVPYYYNEVTTTVQWEIPPEFEKLRTGPPGANVFVFHVPNDWNNEDLRRHFSDWGTVLSARIVQDKGASRHKGYAFVSYDNLLSAVTAVQQMNGFLVGNKRLKVSIKQGEEQYVEQYFAGGVCGNSGQSCGNANVGAGHQNAAGAQYGQSYSSPSFQQGQQHRYAPY